MRKKRASKTSKRRRHRRESSAGFSRLILLIFRQGAEGGSLTKGIDTRPIVVGYFSRLIS